MAAERPTSTPAEGETPSTGSTAGAAVVSDPALAAPDSPVETPVATTEVVEPAVVEPAVAEPAVVEPVAEAPALVEPAAPVPVVVEPVAAEPVAAEQVVAEPVVAEPVAVAEPVVAAHAVVAPAQQVVYVEAPKPFIKKGNRGFGILIAVLSTVIFAALYAGALVISELVTGGSVDFSFVYDSDAASFWPPVATFLVGFVLLVLIVNRAGWAAHVLGSLFVGLFVFFAGTGAILLFHISEIPSNQVGATYKQVLLSVPLIVAGLLAREVSLWMGAAIASRGRKVKARNVDARVVYDQEIAAKRAEYERANAAATTTTPVVPVEAPATETVSPTATAEVPAETVAP